MFEQVKEQLDSQIDLYAIQQAIANAQTVTDSSAFSLATASGSGGFYKDVKAARNLLHDTAGVRLRATHLFAVGDFCDYLASLADGGGRPIFTPMFFDDDQLPLRAGKDNDPGGAEGYTGFNLAGLFLFADDNIPNSGSNIQLIVTKPSTILALEGTPVPYLYPESFAGNLEAVFGVRQYVATIARFPSGVATISGSAYAASTFA